jgi:glutamate-5-semialdehyde dehydrogenase
MQDFLKKAKDASSICATLNSGVKNRILVEMADALDESKDRIVSENKRDLDYATEHNLSDAMVDRLLLDEARIKGMSNSLRQIASLKEPVGRVLEGWSVDSGLQIQKVSVPIGVIGIIYESRPNVTSDTAGLCFKSRNVCVLKGGKEAQYSNAVIAEVYKRF